MYTFLQLCNNINVNSKRKEMNENIYLFICLFVCDEVTS